jgi:hypothetical protein
MYKIWSQTTKFRTMVLPGIRLIFYINCCQFENLGCRLLWPFFRKWWVSPTEYGPPSSNGITCNGGRGTSIAPNGSLVSRDYLYQYKTIYTNGHRFGPEFSRPSYLSLLIPAISCPMESAVSLADCVQRLVCPPEPTKRLKKS